MCGLSDFEYLEYVFILRRKYDSTLAFFAGLRRRAGCPGVQFFMSKAALFSV